MKHILDALRACNGKKGCPNIQRNLKNSIAETKNSIAETMVNTKLGQIWRNRMDSKEKKMSRGAQNIFRVIKTRMNFGNKNLWRRCDHGLKGPRYGKPHRGHDH